ncbi:hypothetical protein CBD41_09265, partial [bacterium TMED181]
MIEFVSHRRARSGYPADCLIQKNMKNCRGGWMSLPKGNAVVAQSGGPTVVINASLAGVVEAIQKSGLADSIFGARHAVRGMLEGNLV